MKHQKVECTNSIVFKEYTDTSPLIGCEEQNGKVKVLIGKKRDLLMSLSSGFITQNGQIQTTCTAPMQLLSMGPCISLEKTLYYILLTLGSICQNLVALSTFGKF